MRERERERERYWQIFQFEAIIFIKWFPKQLDKAVIDKARWREEM